MDAFIGAVSEAPVSEGAGRGGCCALVDSSEGREDAADRSFVGAAIAAAAAAALAALFSALRAALRAARPSASLPSVVFAAAGFESEVETDGAGIGSDWRAFLRTGSPSTAASAGSDARLVLRGDESEVLAAAAAAAEARGLETVGAVAATHSPSGGLDEDGAALGRSEELAPSDRRALDDDDVGRPDSVGPVRRIKWTVEAASDDDGLGLGFGFGSGLSTLARDAGAADGRAFAAVIFGGAARGTAARCGGGRTRFSCPSSLSSSSEESSRIGRSNEDGAGPTWLLPGAYRSRAMARCRRACSQPMRCCA